MDGLFPLASAPIGYLALSVRPLGEGLGRGGEESCRASCCGQWHPVGRAGCPLCPSCGQILSREKGSFLGSIQTMRVFWALLARSDSQPVFYGRCGRHYTLRATVLIVGLGGEFRWTSDSPDEKRREYVMSLPGEDFHIRYLRLQVKSCPHI